MRQGEEAEDLMSELDTAQRRRAYIASFYGHRLWAGSAAFSRAEVDFMSGPFSDPQRLRASRGIYAVAAGRAGVVDPPRIVEKNPTPTLVLYGSRDHVVPATFTARCRVAFPHRMGPFTVDTAGHFVQWEDPELFNTAVAYFLGDGLAG